VSGSDPRAAKAGHTIDVRELVAALRADPEAIRELVAALRGELVAALRADREAARELARVLAFAIAAGQDAEPPFYTTEPNGPRPREYVDRRRTWRDLVPRITGATPLGKRWWRIDRAAYEAWRSSQAVGASQSPVATSAPDPPWRVGQCAEDLGFRPQRKAGAR
jgi:hypothetical protein